MGSFPNKDTQFSSSRQPDIPGGTFKKGSIHLSTHIQNLLNDEEFSPELMDGKEFKGTPLKAIIMTAMTKAQEGDNKWADWLAKYGYGNKLEIEHSGEIKGEVDPLVAARFKDFLAQDTLDG